MAMRNDKNQKSRFSPGELIKIRTNEDISTSLDVLNKHDGCLFMQQMCEYCGQSFKILKIVNNFFDEFKYKMYKPRSPLYILEGLICTGNVSAFPQVCDRSCYLLWHEDWLEPF